MQPARRFIPVPIDWPRSRAFRALRDADPAHVGRFLWLVNQAHLVNRAGAVVLANGQMLTPSDCAALSDRDGDAWQKCCALLVDLGELHIDGEGMQLLCWREWRLDGGESGRYWWPLPLDWPQEAAFRALRDADPAHVGRFLWLVNQAHLSNRAGSVALANGQQLTLEDCAALYDGDREGWQRCAELLEQLGYIDVGCLSLSPATWAQWGRQERSAEAPRPKVSPTPAVTKAPASTRQGRKPKDMSPEQRAEHKRELARLRKQKERGVTHVTQSENHVTQNEEKRDMSRKEETMSRFLDHVTQNEGHVTQNDPKKRDIHEHEDRYEDLKSSNDQHGSSKLDQITLEPKPPLMSSDDRSLFDSKFFRDWSEVMNRGFVRLIGRRFEESDWDFTATKLLRRGASTWRQYSPEVRAHAIVWACEQVLAQIAERPGSVGQNNLWPYACSIASTHCDPVHEQLRQNALMSSRGRSTRPLRFFARTSQRRVAI